MPKPEDSSVLTLCVPRNLDRRIQRKARRRRTTKSAILREALQSAFGDGPPPDDPAREARLAISGKGRRSVRLSRGVSVRG
jgi:hypothetical protein